MKYLRRWLAVVLVAHTPLILADDDCRSVSSEQDTVADLAAMQPSRTWTIDYRVRSMFDSHTSYQFGTPETEPGAYAPLSKLDWPLNSTWHGLQVGLEKPNWDVHFEWLTPMTQHVSGEMVDYDWSGPNRAPASVSVSPERWNDGQMLDLGGEFKLTERFFTLPIEVWPTAGFRFQRFNMTAYDGLQVINDGTMPDIPPVGYRWQEDMIAFNQQYYMSYIGGQLRTKLDIAKLPIDLRFQGDWAGTWGYNVDHHISGYEAAGVHRYTMERTSGGTLHLAIIAEAQLRRHLSVGLQADYLEIRTTGTHHFLMYGAETANETWTNGVSAVSDQKSLTAFVRAEF